MALHPVGRLEEFPVGSASAVTLGEREIAIFHLEDGLYALDNRCPHRGGPLAEGIISQDVVSCPWHLWDFDIRSGQCLTGPNLCQSTYRVVVQDGQVCVTVESGAPSSSRQKASGSE